MHGRHRVARAQRQDRVLKHPRREAAARGAGGYPRDKIDAVPLLRKEASGRG